MKAKVVLIIAAAVLLLGGLAAGGLVVGGSLRDLNREVASLQRDLAAQKEANSRLSERVDRLRGDLAASESRSEARNLDVAKVITQVKDAVYTVIGQQATGTAFAVAHAHEDEEVGRGSPPTST